MSMSMRIILSYIPQYAILYKCHSLFIVFLVPSLLTPIFPVILILPIHLYLSSV